MYESKTNLNTYKSSFRTGLVILALLLGVGCSSRTDGTKSNFKVVVTTSILTDLVQNIGGDEIEVTGLMGPGVDPHLYKASEGDVARLAGAKMIVYNGLHLEGKLVDVLEKMESRQVQTIALGDSLEKTELIASKAFGSSYDPHVWFNIRLVKEFAQTITSALATAIPEKASEFERNNQLYQKKLDSLEAAVREEISKLPAEKRILVTAHDAFNYFGKEYGFNVVGLQGISTAAEAGVQDVQRLTNFIIEHRVKAIFVESSVPRRTIEALQAAVRAKKHEVQIGGSLYSDALGTPGTDDGTYIGMFSHNVKTIVNALQ